MQISNWKRGREHGAKRKKEYFKYQNANIKYQIGKGQRAWSVGREEYFKYQNANIKYQNGKGAESMERRDKKEYFKYQNANIKYQIGKGQRAWGKKKKRIFQISKCKLQISNWKRAESMEQKE